MTGVLPSFHFPFHRAVCAGIGRCGGYPGAHAVQGNVLPYVGGSLLGEGEGTMSMPIL